MTEIERAEWIEREKAYFESMFRGIKREKESYLAYIINRLEKERAYIAYHIRWLWFLFVVQAVGSFVGLFNNTLFIEFLHGLFRW